MVAKLIPRHRKNDPLWRKHRLQPTPAFSRFPPIRSLTLEGQLRVDLTPSPSHRRMAAICAYRTTEIDDFVANTTARFRLTGKIAHDDLVRPATGSRLQSSGTPWLYVPYTLGHEPAFAPRGQRIEDAVRSRSDYV